jgi:hypothetical protein
MQSTQLAVLEQSHEVVLCCFLNSLQTGSCEAERGVELIGDGLDEALKGRSLYEECSGALVFAYLSQGKDPGSEAVRSLHSTGLVGEVFLTRRAGGLVGGLLRSGYWQSFMFSATTNFLFLRGNSTGLP